MMTCGDKRGTEEDQIKTEEKQEGSEGMDGGRICFLTENMKTTLSQRSVSCCQCVVCVSECPDQAGRPCSDRGVCSDGVGGNGTCSCQVTEHTPGYTHTHLP